MSDGTPTLDSVAETVGCFTAWSFMFAINAIVLQQWRYEGFFLANGVMFVVMFGVTGLFLSVQFLLTKWLWRSSRTVLLNRDIVRTCRSVWSEWRSQFRN